MINMKKNIIKVIIALLILSVVFGPKIYSRLNSKNFINDYYDYINHDYIEKNPIEENTTGWSMIEKYQDEVDDEVDKIADNLINSNNKNINIMYNDYKNLEQRNKIGIKPLQKYIDGINNSKNINELINEIFIVEKDLKLFLLANPKIAKDFTNSSKYIVYFYPISFDFNSDSTIYSNSDYDSYAAIIQKYVNRILKLYGYEEKEARKIANEIYDMKKDIASKSKKSNEYDEIISYYNIIDKNELQNIYSNIDFEKYLNIKGLNNREYSIVDIENYKAFNAYLKNSNLELLKNYFICRILESYAPALTEDYLKLYNSLNNELNGETKEFDIDEITRDEIISLYNDIVQEEYAKLNFSDKDKKEITDMIDEIISYYKNDINSLTWMDQNTKEKAILKLDNLKINVGLFNNKIYSDKYNIKESNNLIENYISINDYLYKQTLKYLDTNEDPVGLMNTYTVNAYYNPQENSINFPCAAKKFIQSDDYYSKLGSIGMVVAHEITHAFDNNGRKFNEKGEYKDWWTKKDSNNFETLSNKIIDYYSEYSVLGIPIDGKRTLGENIADLGALKCISSLAESHKATNEEYKRMYSSYAKWTAYNITKEYKKLLITADTHSPNEIRVNAVLSSTDKFYETYNINKNDKMYKDKEERVGIW